MECSCPSRLKVPISWPIGNVLLDPKSSVAWLGLATTMDTPTLGYATTWRFPKQLLVEWARTGPTRLPHLAGSQA